MFDDAAHLSTTIRRNLARDFLQRLSLADVRYALAAGAAGSPTSSQRGELRQQGPATSKQRYRRLIPSSYMLRTANGKKAISYVAYSIHRRASVCDRRVPLSRTHTLRLNVLLVVLVLSSCILPSRTLFVVRL